MTHTLKTWPEYFQAVRNGSKTFEVRKLDRDFCVGDWLILREWNPVDESFTGFEEIREVSYILRGGQFGVEEGFCVMGLKNIP